MKQRKQGILEPLRTVRKVRSGETHNKTTRCRYILLKARQSFLDCRNGIFYAFLLLLLTVIFYVMRTNTDSICGLCAKSKCQRITSYRTNSDHSTLINPGEENQTEISRSGYNYFNWTPGEAGNINAPVDELDFKYNRFDEIKPRQTTTDHRDIVPLEIKPKSQDVGSSLRIYLVDDFLSSYECDMLKLVHNDHLTALREPLVCFANIGTLRYHLKLLHQEEWKPSHDAFIQGTKCLNNSMSSLLISWGLRWSKGTAFYPGESDFSLILSRRLEDVLALKDVNGGAFRLVSYPPSVGYKAHTDCSREGHKGRHDRFATVLIYLNDVAIGGHTYFPLLGVSVKPKKGRALVWNSMTTTGTCDTTSLHAALPADKQTKYILQRWYYYDNFPGVSKRPPVPPIPERDERQAMVSCDGYKYGSCRLYDTWTYDILTNW